MYIVRVSVHILLGKTYVASAMDVYSNGNRVPIKMNIKESLCKRNSNEMLLTKNITWMNSLEAAGEEMLTAVFYYLAIESLHT